MEERQLGLLGWPPQEETAVKVLRRGSVLRGVPGGALFILFMGTCNETQNQEP
jgi:hypothetical protein